MRDFLQFGNIEKLSNLIKEETNELTSGYGWIRSPKKMRMTELSSKLDILYLNGTQSVTYREAWNLVRIIFCGLPFYFGHK